MIRVSERSLAVGLRKLRNEDYLTPQLGLGLAALGRPGYVTLNHARDLGGTYDPSAMEAHAHEVLDAAFEAGIRYVDAARSYGRAEDFVASWLRARKIAPSDVVVASKWGYTYTADWSTSAQQHEIKDHSLAAFERQFAESYERLGRYLSLYQIHSVTADGKTLEDDALIDAIARLREKGIRAGLSVSGAGQDVAIRRALTVRRDGERVFDSVQATWNLLERGAESALAEAHDAGMKSRGEGITGQRPADSGKSKRRSLFFAGRANPRAGRESGNYDREARSCRRTRASVGGHCPDGRGNGRANPFERRGRGS